jgi:hypothetical protein
VSILVSPLLYFLPPVASRVNLEETVFKRHIGFYMSLMPLFFLTPVASGDDLEGFFSFCSILHVSLFLYFLYVESSADAIFSEQPLFNPLT